MVVLWGYRGVDVFGPDRPTMELLTEAIRLQNTFLLVSSSVLHGLMGLGYGQYTRWVSEIQTVTPKDVQKAAAKYSGMSGYMEAQVFPPFEKPPISQ